MTAVGEPGNEGGNEGGNEEGLIAADEAVGAGASASSSISASPMYQHREGVLAARSAQLTPAAADAPCKESCGWKMYKNVGVWHMGKNTSVRRLGLSQRFADIWGNTASV